jgi:putative sterol carrier protein
MSKVVEEFVGFLDDRARGNIQGTAKLVITDEGSVFLTEEGARVGDDAADIVLLASEDVFRAILAGDKNPTMAYMSGALKVEGNAMRALKVSDILTAN